MNKVKAASVLIMYEAGVKPEDLLEDKDHFWDYIVDEYCHYENWKLLEIISVKLTINSDSEDLVEYTLNYRFSENGMISEDIFWLQFVKKNYFRSVG